MQERFHLGLNVREVGILPHLEPGGVVAYAVEPLGLLRGPGSLNIRDDVRRHEIGLAKISEDALDGAVGAVQLDDLSCLDIHLAGERFADEDIVLAHKAIEASFQKAVLRKHLEEVGIRFDTRDLTGLLPALYDGTPKQRQVRSGLHFRDVHFQFLLVPIGKPQELVAPQHEGALPVRRLVRHLILLHHIRSNQDYERQTHGQPHRLDGGVELVSGQKFQVTFHLILFSVQPPDSFGRP